MALQAWKVVGGGDKGGIVVRKGEDLKSDEEKNRLATGSLVRELQLKSGRLQYELMTGSGPRSGWVSVALNQRPLLVKHQLPERGSICTEETYTRERALQMMDEFIAAYENSSFQKTLRAAWRKAGSNEVAKGKAKQAICLEVQVPIVIKYGFEPNIKGVMRSVSMSSALSTDEEIIAKGQYLSVLVDPDMQDKIESEKKAAEPDVTGKPNLLGVTISSDTGESKVKGVTKDGKYVFAYVGKLNHPHDVLALIPLNKEVVTKDDLAANRARLVFAGGTDDEASSVTVQKEVIIDVQGLENGDYELGAFAHDNYEEQLNAHMQQWNCVVMWQGKAAQVVAQYKA